MKLRTRNALIEQIELGGDPNPLIVYDTLEYSLREFQYGYFGTLTSPTALVDWAGALELNRLYRRIVNRHFYGRRDHLSPLKFIFVVHSHRLKKQFLRRYHVHYLMTEIKSLVNQDESLFEFDDPFGIEIAAHDHMAKCAQTLGLNQCSDKEQLKRVYFQEGITDYLLRELRTNPHDLLGMIDVENSDLTFQYENTN